MNADGSRCWIRTKARFHLRSDGGDQYAKVVTGWTIHCARRQSKTNNPQYFFRPDVCRGSGARHQLEDHFQQHHNSSRTNGGAGLGLVTECTDGAADHGAVRFQQLIQHLVTSNPSRRTWRGIQRVFERRHGVTGNLQAVIAQIPPTRKRAAGDESTAESTNKTFGHLREPVSSCPICYAADAKLTPIAPFITTPPNSVRICSMHPASSLLLAAVSNPRRVGSPPSFKSIRRRRGGPDDIVTAILYGAIDKGTT